ncbi:type II secretion system GspH family protein [Jeotgalibaca sp. MA1X17-3]|uniref:competence type IV pilus minor pilin ComGD n=1 Tax=Jeotgalibaca sp. MA1X17-3 TaxID=2908211 RepID=UPI001F2E4FAB|nr:competence type IV pilus minor pilin ComGD [Jeotgalibaca sp. MA1X17-3]UJF14663.1 type II secretion system GspH family protein [Jeotgalibaca sp. MA1X17-3]
MSKNILQNQNGFTLFETLVVLSITTLLVLLIPIQGFMDTNELSEQFFFEDFLTQWENAQNYAVITGEPVKVELRKPINGISQIKFITNNGNVTFIDQKISVPASVSILENQSYWIKKSSGYITPQTIIFRTERYLFKIKIQFGNGRYHIEKTEI